MSSKEAAARALSVRIREIDAEIRALRRERAALTLAGDALTEKPVKQRKRAGDVAIAGPKAVKAVDDFLRKRGAAYQSEITKATGLNSGTVTHALRALAGDKLVVATENTRRGSREFRHLGVQTTPARGGRRLKAAA